MRIIFYRSALCPRCFMASKYLREIVGVDPSIVVEEIDILRHPLRAWQDGIRCIPALAADGKKLSGLYLDKRRIAAFITSCKKIIQD